MNSSNNLYVGERHGYLYVRWLTGTQDEWQALLFTFEQHFPDSAYDRRHRGWAIPSTQAAELERWARPRFDEWFWMSGQYWGQVEKEGAA
jgi:hypothetical protein